MSNTAEIGNRLEEDALHVTEAYYGPEFFSSDTELEVMLDQALNGNKTPYTSAQITEELINRTINGLVTTLSKQVEALNTAILRDYLRLKCAIKRGTVSMSIDDVVTKHEILSVHVNDVRRKVDRLKRHTKCILHPLPF